ncbi:hypothetical protein NPIL_638921 [Nephila pilipes]|uniref:Uncharacterized protein n=1 Tax=Nephila pilipes TaxID=299642 RepID=A0A8X6NE16_NEPPI|nr:hypothetical protein NPIL_638921 [Nephila pilipes]
MVNVFSVLALRIATNYSISKKSSVKAQITKLGNWKETEDHEDTAVHLIVLEKLQKLDDIIRLHFESATGKEINEFEVSLVEMDFDTKEAEIFFELLTAGKIVTAVHSLPFRETGFRYICKGAIEGSPETRHLGSFTQEKAINETLKDFWELESNLGEVISNCKEEIELE